MFHETITIIRNKNKWDTNLVTEEAQAAVRSCKIMPSMNADAKEGNKKTLRRPQKPGVNLLSTLGIFPDYTIADVTKHTMQYEN